MNVFFFANLCNSISWSLQWIILNKILIQFTHVTLRGHSFEKKKFYTLHGYVSFWHVLEKNLKRACDCSRKLESSSSNDALWQVWLKSTGSGEGRRFRAKNVHFSFQLRWAKYAQKKNWSYMGQYHYVYTVHFLVWKTNSVGNNINIATI